MRQYVTEMKIAKLSPVTIADRIEVLERLRRYLDGQHGVGLLDAAPEQLRGFQATFAHLAPASVNIYTRHVRAFYQWATDRGRVAANPAASLVVPRIPRTRPHPTRLEDLRIVLRCTPRGALRLVYVLAAFAGLRRGEICRLQRPDLDLDSTLATALIHGKGGHERTVPLLRPVVDELYGYGLPRAGYVVLRGGRPYDPEMLSVDSHRHLASLGVETTLHSMRATFATCVARATRDPLFARDLLGHQSVATTEVYMESSTADAHLRLAPLTTLAAELLCPVPGTDLRSHG